MAINKTELESSHYINLIHQDLFNSTPMSGLLRNKLRDLKIHIARLLGPLGGDLNINQRGLLGDCSNSF